MSYTYTALSDCTTAVYNVDNIIKSAAPKLVDSLTTTTAALHQGCVSAADTSSYLMNASACSQFHSSFFANSLNYTNVTSPLSPKGAHAIFGKSTDVNGAADSSVNSVAVRPARYCHDPYNRSLNSMSLLTVNELSPEESFSACYGGDAADKAPRGQEMSPQNGKKVSASGQSKKRRQQDGPSARPQPSSCTVVPHTTKRAPSPVEPQRRRSPPTTSDAKTFKDATTLAAVMQQQSPVAEVSVRANVLSFFQSAALYTSSVEQANTSSESEATHSGATRAVRTVVACGRVDRTSGRPVVRALTAAQ